MRVIQVSAESGNTRLFVSVFASFDGRIGYTLRRHVDWFTCLHQQIYSPLGIIKELLCGGEVWSWYFSVQLKKKKNEKNYVCSFLKKPGQLYFSNIVIPFNTEKGRQWFQEFNAIGKSCGDTRSPIFLYFGVRKQFLKRKFVNNDIIYQTLWIEDYFEAQIPKILNVNVI